MKLGPGVQHQSNVGKERQKHMTKKKVLDLNKLKELEKTTIQGPGGLC